MKKEPIAIVGMGCRFPGADGVDAFWRLLRDGVDAIGEVPRERWDVDALYDADLLTAGRMSSRWGGFVDDVDAFDAALFGIGELEAKAMDPQQRLLLEVSWAALEHAGLVPRALAGSRGGVFIGVAYNDYATRAADNAENFSSYSPSGTELSMVANRLSHFYDLRGPSLAVNTGCSSSLVAVHLAVRSLQSGEADVALAGGVSLILAPEATIALSQAWMLAADGRCKTFDARADGYVRGEGCGAVVLKRLADAERDGDRILAVIRGSAVNHGGRGDGLTAPNGDAQREVMRAALAEAAVAPSAVGFIEAHGVGTRLGDATEMAALHDVYGDDADGGRCAVGSVKTNIGHLEWASGIASLIKSVLALQYETVPAHLHLQTLNPSIRLDGTRFVIPTAPLPWPRDATARLCGVNSFGLGGTNAHVVVAEAAPRVLPAADERPLLLALSAPTRGQLSELARRHADALDGVDAARLARHCATTNARRTVFDERVAFVAPDGEAMRAALESFAEAAPPAPRAPRQAPRIAFLFTGQGSQYAGMARALTATQPLFRAALERCAATLDRLLPVPLFDVLHAEASPIHDTTFAQPALFAIEWALAVLWRSFGVEPAAVLGHSVGEYVAACVAGALSLDDALTLIATRGRLMGSLPRGGAMLSVVETEERVREAIAAHADRVSIAAINGPRNVVVSGDAAAIDAIAAALDDDFVATQRLTVSHAFHSPLMEPILDAFEETARRADARPLTLPLASNLTGELLAPGHRFSAIYWRQHLRGAVRFADGIAQLAASGIDTFLEVGPTDTLSKLGRRCVADGGARFLAALRPNEPEWQTLLGSVGALYCAGANIDFAALEGERARPVVDVPGYPFERRRFWFLPPASESASPAPTPSAEAPLLRELHAVAPPLRAGVVRRFLRAETARLLSLADGAQPDASAGLVALGLTSLAAVELQARLQKALGGALSIPATTLFDHPTIDALAAWTVRALWPEAPAPDAPVAVAPSPHDEPIAIVGLGVRLPGGVTTPEALWELLARGGDATSDVPSDRWDVDALYDADPARSGHMYTRRGGFLDDVAGFDADFFGITAREAESIDPQQRILLEVAHEALERAGCSRERLAGSRTGVFVGLISNEYGARPAAPQTVDAHQLLGSLWSAAAGRISYLFGLRGPSLVVDTACSSSLVALHLACRSLRAGECDRALAGGVNLVLSPTGTIALCRAGALAPDGRCKTFDERADGYARGEGCGVVVLRRLSDALADGDHVLAVVRGSAVNHDGRTAGFTVPSGAAQAELVRAALADAGIAADDVDYVEAHGTGTALGDPIEVDALARVFAGRAPERPLRLGSIKANVGHLEAAAGISGVIKTVLALAHGELPPHPHLERVNPRIDLAAIPADIPVRPQPWPPRERPRRAGVSAFGMSGTNAHVVLEEAPAIATRPAAAAPRSIRLSARSDQALRELAARWRDWLRAHDVALDDVAWTAQRRARHAHEVVLRAATIDELGALLSRVAAGDHVDGAAVEAEPAPHGRNLPLPPHPWRHRRFWKPAAEGAHATTRAWRSGEPWLTPDVVPADAHAPTLWTCSVERTLTAALIAELACAIADERLGPAAHLLRDVRLSPWRGAGKIQASWQRQTLGEHRLRLWADADGDWREIADARVWADPDEQAVVRQGEGDVFAAALADADAAPLARVAIAQLRHLADGVEVRGLCFTEEGAATQSVDSWLHGVSWRERAAEPAGDGNEPLQLVDHDSVVGRRLARALARSGRTAVAVASLDELRAGGTVVDLRGLDGADNHESVEGAAALLALAQRLTTLRPAPRLVVATRRAIAVEPVDDVAPSTAALWGLGRVVQNEEPALRCTLVDVDGTAEAMMDALTAELAAGAPDAQVAHRDGRRLVPALGALPPAARASSTGDEARMCETAQPGFLDAVRFRFAPRRAPACGEVEVAVTHLPLSFVDVMTATGLDDPDARGARALGIELCGRVVRVGADVRALRAGDLVCGFAPDGVGTFVTTRAALLTRVPAALEPGAAATIPLAFVVAHHALVDVARLQPGERVLIHSASGAIGQACIQYARAIGARVLATAGDEERRAWLRAGGVDDVFDSRTLAFADEVRAATGGEGVDVVVNCIAGGGARASAGLLRPFGRLVDLNRRSLTTTDATVTLPPNTTHVRVDVVAAMRSSPERIGKLLGDVMARVAAGELAPLPTTELGGDDTAAALRSMAQLRHLGKVVVRLDPPPRAEAAATLALRGDATYLVTGGLGGLGLAVARWLVERGARHVALVGRRPPSDGARETIAALAAAGARVVALAADVGDGDAVLRLLDEVRRTMPPLAGVVHAAGLLDDAMLSEQDAARLGAVMAPKVAGAWYLHALVHEPLDFFVLFSSIAAVVGTPGQANYAAANAALDAIAQHRRAHGLPAISIAWGPWADVGMAARGGLEERAARSGLLPMAPALALQALERALATDAAHVVVADARWRTVASALPGFATSFRAGVADELAAVDDRSTAETTALRARLAAAPASSRSQLIGAWLRDAVAAITRAPADQVALDAPVDRAGMDSIMAVELKNRSQQALGVSLSVADYLRSGTLAAVGDELLRAAGFAIAATAAVVDDASGKWLERFSERPDAGTRLFCFPFAGGGPTMFRALAEGLPSTIDVAAIRLPGRGVRGDEPPARRMAELIAPLADAIAPLLDRPYAMFGHCMGAIVMFELAHELRRRGAPLPDRLFVSASPAPDGYVVPALDPSTGRFLNARPGDDRLLVPVHALPRTEFFDVLRFLNFGGARVLLDEAELARTVLPMVQADFEVCGTYRHTPQPPLSVPLSAFGGVDDPFATRRELERWARETDAGFALQMRPGDHYYLFPDVAWLTQAIAERLRPSEAAPGRRRSS